MARASYEILAETEAKCLHECRYADDFATQTSGVEVHLPDAPPIPTFCLDVSGNVNNSHGYCQ
jgi:hypothetical protein